MSKIDYLLKLLEDVNNPSHVKTGHKMVDNIEKKRKAGKYSKEERIKLAHKFAKNIKANKK